MSRTIIASAEKTLHIGKQGENLATIVSFADILEKWVAEFGNGSLSLAFQRAEDEAPYLVPLNNAEWTVTSADLAQAGTGLCELIYTVDGIVKKSLRWRTCTLNSLGFTVDPPEPWQAYIDTVISKVAEVENMTVSSETLDASSEATVEKTVGDAVNLHFGIPKGFDGFSPAVSVAQTSTGHIISITDATGTKTVAVDNGAKGDDGFSPSVTLEAIEDGTAIIITDAEGDKRFEVHNGSDASVTAENIRNALDYTPADNAKAMEYKVLTFDGTVFKDSDGNTLTFSQIKTLCLDTKNFVYALYSNRLYIPQYVSNSNIFFEASYIQSDKPQMHRISISSSNAVTQYDMMLATESSVSTLKADLTELDGRVETLENEPKVPETLVAQVDDNTRQIDALWKLNKGYTWDFETDSADGDKVVPTGAKQASVLRYDGKSVVWNQGVRADSNVSGNSISTLKVSDGEWQCTISNTVSYAHVRPTYERAYTSGKKYVLFAKIKSEISGNVFRFAIGKSNLTDIAYGAFFSVSNAWATYADIITAPTVDTSLSTILNVDSRILTTGEVFSIGRIYAVNLTAMGWDDITSTDDPRIAWIEQYAAAHPEYNAGEIISADVESVTARGRNLIDYPYVGQAVNNRLLHSTRIPLEWIADGTTVTISADLSVPTEVSSAYVASKSANGSSNVRTGSVVRSGKRGVSKLTFVKSESEYFVGASYGTGEGNVVVHSYQVEIGSSETEYAPYRTPIVRTIPTAIRQLDGYGWSAGTARNYLEYTADGKWMYHRNVNKALLDSLTWTQDYTNYRFRANLPSDGYNPVDAWSDNVLTPAYPSAIWDTSGDKFISIGRYASQGRVYIKNTAYPDNSLDVFIADISGIDVYYQCNEIVTDVTDLMGDALKEFEVESGGTITFDNDALLSVPNRVEYLIALNEVVS